MQAIYVNPDPAAKARATALGCGWVASVPAQFDAVAPCVILTGGGVTVVIQDDPPTTRAAVAAASAPILADEAAAAATAAAEQTNLASLTEKAAAAIQANINALALPDPTGGNDTYLAQPAIPGGTLTTAQLGAALRIVRTQTDSLTRQSTAAVAQLRAVTKQSTAVIRILIDALDTTEGT